MGEGGSIFRGIDRKWERRVEGRRYMGFDDKVDFRIGVVNMTDLIGIGDKVHREWERGNLANSRRDAAAGGAFRFCTRRIFLGGEGQLRDSRSLS